MKRSIPLALLFVCLLGCGEKPDTLVESGYDQKEMDAAIARAGKEVDAFIKELNEPTGTNHAVKAPIEDGGKTEAFLADPGHVQGRRIPRHNQQRPRHREQRQERPEVDDQEKGNLRLDVHARRQNARQLHDAPAAQDPAQGTSRQVPVDARGTIKGRREISNGVGLPFGKPDYHVASTSPIIW